MAKDPELSELWVDGACRGNPGGHSGAGAILKHNGLIINRSKYLGRMNSNEAEYNGLLLGLLLANERGVTKLKIYTDSELMHNQMHGFSRTQTPSLLKLQETIWDLLDKLEFWQLVHVFRNENRGADILASKAAASEKSSKDRIYDPSKRVESPALGESGKTPGQLALETLERVKTVLEEKDVGWELLALSLCNRGLEMAGESDAGD